MHLIREQLPPGSKIFLLTLSVSDLRKQEKFRQVKQALLAEGITLVNFNYKPFGWRMFFKLIYILIYLVFFALKNKVRGIHAWCTPGGSIGYVLSIITGIPLTLDSFEPHAETMVETGTWRKNSLAYRALFFLERLQLARAKHVICAAAGMKDYSQKTYGITKDHYYVKPACVDLKLFQRHPAKKPVIEGIPADAVVCVYAGKFGDIYLTREVFDLFRVAGLHWGARFRVLLLTNHTDEELHEFCRSAQVDPSILLRRFVPHHEVPDYMALGHFGICPVNPVPTKEFCTPIKNGEYWAMGLPVVITRNISTDSRLIDENKAGYVLQQLNDEEYQRAVQRIDELLQEPSLGVRIRLMAEEHRNFAIAEKIYAEIYRKNFLD